MKVLMSLIPILMAFAAVAQGHLDVQTTVQKQETFVNEAGETEQRLVAADVAVPGERVIYTMTFTNISDESAEKVVITNPIEDGLVYVDGSAFGPGTDITFSVDDGASFAAASDLTVTEDGESRPAEAKDYTHIRWVMKNDLAAGAQATARFAAILE